MKKYIKHWYSDKRGIGEEKVYNTETEAIEALNSDWNRWTREEKEQLDICIVYEAELTESELSSYNEGELEASLYEYCTKDMITLSILSEKIDGVKMIKHKSLDLTAEDMFDIAKGWKDIPYGVVINIAEDGKIVASPVGEPLNLSGNVDVDYEIAHNEEDE